MFDLHIVLHNKFFQVGARDHSHCSERGVLPRDTEFTDVICQLGLSDAKLHKGEKLIGFDGLIVNSPCYSAETSTRLHTGRQSPSARFAVVVLLLVDQCGRVGVRSLDAFIVSLGPDVL